MSEYVVSFDGDIWAVEYDEALNYYRENIDEECEYVTVEELIKGEGLDVRGEFDGYIDEYGNEVDTREWFNDSLDSAYDLIEVMGVTATPSVFLANVDPVAYREYHRNYINALVEDDDLFDSWQAFHDAHN